MRFLWFVYLIEIEKGEKDESIHRTCIRFKKLLPPKATFKKLGEGLPVFLFSLDEGLLTPSLLSAPNLWYNRSIL